MPRVVLFDIDSTLLTTGGAGRAAMAAAFTEVLQLDDPMQGVVIDGRTDHAIFGEVLGRFRADTGDHQELREAVTHSYLAKLPAFLQKRAGELLPGVPGLLDALTRECIPIGLATGNLRRGSELKLAHFGIDRYFRAGGFGDSSPQRVDVVRQGIAAMSALLGMELKPSECVVIGDTPHDIRSARTAGAMAVGVATGSFTAEILESAGADAVLANLCASDDVLSLVTG